MKSTDIRKLKFEDLKAFGASLGVPYKGEDKKHIYLEDVLKANAAAVGTKMSNDIELTEQMKEILGLFVSKSEKIRQLADAGMPTAQISRELNAHYSFVHGILSSRKKMSETQKQIEELRQQIEAASQSQPEQPVVNRVEQKRAKKEKVATA